MKDMVKINGPQRSPSDDLIEEWPVVGCWPELLWMSRVKQSEIWRSQNFPEDRRPICAVRPIQSGRRFGRDGRPIIDLRRPSIPAFRLTDAEACRHHLQLIHCPWGFLEQHALVK